MDKKKREIVIVEYQSNWPAMFQEEVAALYPIFWMCWRDVYHIGSTAVPGLASKPTVDVLLCVKDINKADAFNDMLLDMGYIAKGEYGIPGRRYFHKGDHVHLFHLHVFGYNSPEIERHVLFRDYLRSHPDELRAYEALKRKLAETYRDDPEAYTDGKEEFIRQADFNALKWKSETGWQLPSADWTPQD